MSNNFYAQLKLGGSSHSDNTVIYTMHIGKATWSGEDVGYGISTMNGRHFADIDSWVKFLRHNSEVITITDEENVEHDIEEFIKEFLLNPAPTSDKQIAWLRKNQGNPVYGYDSLAILEEAEPTTWKARYWIDKDSGKLFYSGDFS